MLGALPCSSLACLSSCQNLFGHMCFSFSIFFFFFPVCLRVRLLVCVCLREKERQREQVKEGVLTVRLHYGVWGLFVLFVLVFFVFLLCFFFLLFWESVYVLASVRVTSPCWLTDCCSAFWQTVPLNHAAVVTCSDRTPLPPWDSSIRVPHALNEEVNMLNCLLEDEVERLSQSRMSHATPTHVTYLA